ncbi:MAG: T9SS type A sorting domain-containing protein [Candidatus Kariarchaeaceae archaeon]|jgi:hypothetical protein
MSLKKFISLLVILFFSIVFINWGWMGHRMINFNTILTALPEMDFFNYWADSLADHAYDADYRKQIDPDEGPRHYIDIDNYPEFLENGMINQNFDSLVAIHGYNFVMSQGVLPWAILGRIDSLQTAFEYGDWHSAMLHASDLGHYIADDHMPLHLTRNYNGQYTGQHGIHSRYESNMIGRYSDQIIYEGDTLIYIENISDYVFNIIYDNYVYVDSVLKADSIATAFAGNTTSDLYYEKLWELTKPFTLVLFKNASYKLTRLIYTAWVNAGSPVTSVNEEDLNHVVNYELLQNYPNPFNPSTKIIFTISTSPLNPSPHQGEGNRERFITLKVYDVLGNEIATLVNEEKPAGTYEIEFSRDLIHQTLGSGVYFYQLRAGSFIATKKMVLIR